MVIYDHQDKPDLIQLHMRRSSCFKELDLRDVISRLDIEDGVGHEGAVGFRISKLPKSEFVSFFKDVVNAKVAMVKNVK